MKAKVGDLIRVYDMGYTSKTYFKVIAVLNDREIVVEVDPVKNSLDRDNIYGWFYYNNVHAKYLHLNLNNDKSYWFVYNYEIIKKAKQLLSNE